MICRHNAELSSMPVPLVSWVLLSPPDLGTLPCLHQHQDDLLTAAEADHGSLPAPYSQAHRNELTDERQSASIATQSSSRAPERLARWGITGTHFALTDASESGHRIR
jgi:hypothetical protein